ncbi:MULTISPECIES: HNH endonuclease signature motif containing protein [Mycolicibacterium]|uniref:HNH endonuclease signature motif containing protein n=1 Tax=Mycolicibacterium monacense TaxID=85693 RepID=UPI0007EB250F|nr:HNH endonuclease signature motif containing protein [Mycolicibacterium monacense]OBB70702.1 hypothetical protein A6B34_01395 [Mycolicibacterium monacense]
MYVRRMLGNELQDAVTALRAAFDAVAACDVDLLDQPNLLAALDDLETLGCQLPTMNHRLLARLQAESTPQQLGAKSWKEVLTVRWRISGSEAHRRLTEARLLAPRQALTGPSLPPLLPATAAAQSLGCVTGEHVEVIRKAVDKLPAWVDTATREQFEITLVRTAAGVGPKELKDAADLTLFLLDQDGPEPDDTERARKRGVTKYKQRPDGMVDLRATMTPEAWAVWEVLFAKYAAPGMCNPEDPEPCTSGTPSQAQIDNDYRSLAQRQHDAMLAIGRIALMSGDLGQLNGLPVSIVVRTTLQDLESRAGVGTTGGGTVIPIKDVIRMAGHANHYLAVFDRATGSALDLFRTKRIASPAQRIMLIARDGGCTKPGCTIGAYGCQAHHVDADWIDGGNTNVDELGLACGPDNRSVGTNDGWTTRMNDQHEVEWIPPPQLDTGQARINYHHRPERLLTPPGDPDLPGASAEPADTKNIGDTEPNTGAAGEADETRPAKTAAPVAGETRQAPCAEDATTSLADVNETRPVEPGSPIRSADSAGEPGGPAPPQNRAA